MNNLLFVHTNKLFSAQYNDVRLLMSLDVHAVDLAGNSPGLILCSGREKMNWSSTGAGSLV